DLVYTRGGSASIEVGDFVATSARRTVARGSVHKAIVAPFAGQYIGARTALEPVGKIVANQRVCERAAGQVLNRFIAISRCIAGIGARRAEASSHSGGCMLVGSSIIISSTGEKIGPATAFEGIIAATAFENGGKGPAAE